ACRGGGPAAPAGAPQGGPRRVRVTGSGSGAARPASPAPAPPRTRARPGRGVRSAPAAPALAAVAIPLAVVSDDLRTASHYRHTLQEANGKEFESYSLYGASGSATGTVFSYQGAPSWLLITVDQGHRADLRGAELVMDDGRQVHLNWFHLDRLAR